jgi:hypothetical protein
LTLDITENSTGRVFVNASVIFLNSLLGVGSILYGLKICLLQQCAKSIEGLRMVKIVHNVKNLRGRRGKYRP